MVGQTSFFFFFFLTVQMLLDYRTKAMLITKLTNSGYSNDTTLFASFQNTVGKKRDKENKVASFRIHN